MGWEEAQRPAGMFFFFSCARLRSPDVAPIVDQTWTSLMSPCTLSLLSHPCLLLSFFPSLPPHFLCCSRKSSDGFSGFSWWSIKLNIMFSFDLGHDLNITEQGWCKFVNSKWLNESVMDDLSSLCRLISNRTQTKCCLEGRKSVKKLQARYKY